MRLQLLGAALSCLRLLFETMLPALAPLPCWHACCCLRCCWPCPAYVLCPAAPCCSAERATVCMGLSRWLAAADATCTSAGTNAWQARRQLCCCCCCCCCCSCPLPLPLGHHRGSGNSGSLNVVAGGGTSAPVRRPACGAWPSCCEWAWGGAAPQMGRGSTAPAATWAARWGRGSCWWAALVGWCGWCGRGMVAVPEGPQHCCRAGLCCMAVHGWLQRAG